MIIDSPRRWLQRAERARPVHCEPRRPINTFLFSSTRVDRGHGLRTERTAPLVRPVDPRFELCLIVPRLESRTGIPSPFRGYAYGMHVCVLCVLCVLTRGVTPVFEGSFSKLFERPVARFGPFFHSSLSIDDTHRAVSSRVSFISFSEVTFWNSFSFFCFDETNFIWKFISSFELTTALRF